MSSDGSEVSDYSQAKQIAKGRLNANTPGSSEKGQRMDAEAIMRNSEKRIGPLPRLSRSPYSDGAAVIRLHKKSPLPAF